MPYDLTAGIHVDELTCPEDLESLAPEWASLWNHCPVASVFQSPAWLVPWWQHFGSGRLCTLALRNDTRLIGLVPFFISEGSQSNARELRLIGTGNSDHLDLLIEPGFEKAALESALTWLEENREQWDVCEFQQIPAGSILLQASIPERWRSETKPQTVCPVLSLPTNIDDLSGCIPSDTIKKLHYYRRRAARAGRVQIEIADRDNFKVFFDAFLELHSLRWNARQQPGVLGEATVRQFHHDAASRLLELTRLRLYALLLDDRIVAALYCFSDNRRVAYYLGGFDPATAPLSPGHLLIGHAIEEAVREGATEFDFLSGNESYKYQWGAKDRLNYRRTILHTDQPFKPGMKTDGYG